MSGEAPDVKQTSSADWRDGWRGRLNYRGRKCATCGKTLRLTERKYCYGLCALAGKTAKQARRRTTLRQMAAAAWSRHKRTIG